MRTAVGRVPGLAQDLHFVVHGADDKHVSEQIAANGIWEPFETELIRRFLTSRATRDEGRALFLDCGANIGWYSVLAQVLGADVIAAEPLSSNAELLTLNTERNRGVGTTEIIRAALGAPAGTARLELSATNQGDHRLTTSPAGTSNRQTVDVPVITLDDVLGGRRPDVIKIDTQGSEVAILRGGRSAWNGHTPVLVIEFWPYGLAHCGTGHDELIAMLSELVPVTHDCYEIVEWRAKLAPLTIGDLQEMATVGGFSPAMKGFTNLLLVPTGERAVVADVLQPGANRLDET
jgi:FkbM family methyltransferase